MSSSTQVEQSVRLLERASYESKGNSQTLASSQISSEVHVTSVTIARESHDSSPQGLKATASVLVSLSLASHKTCVSDISAFQDALSVEIILSNRSSDGGVSQPLHAHRRGEVRRTARTQSSCRMVEQHSQTERLQARTKITFL